MINRQFRRMLGILTIFTLELSFSALPLYADAMPTKEQLTSQITSQAQAQTSTIQANTSSAPSATTTTTNTGSNTSTATTSQTSSQTSVSNQNTATVNQTTNAVANTGNNEASRNIAIGGDAGVISTGNATVNATSVTQANTNNTALSSGSSGCGSSTQAVNTGDNTSTSTGCNSTTSTFVNNGNTTTINQTTNTLANTGGNTAARNISIGGSSGVITTGNASTNINSLVTANGSVTLIGGTNNGHGPGSGASIVLANAGDAARFTSLANNSSYLVVTNDNRATIAQTCGAPLDSNQLFINMNACSANTGGNNASRNIARGGDAGVIHTGDAVLNVFMMTNANKNTARITYPSQGSGGPATDVVNTGDNTNTNSSTSSSQSTTIANNNATGINQTTNAVANTGFNKANRNISFGGNAGVITTGNATVNTFMGTAVNTNATQIGSPPLLQGSLSDPYASVLNTGGNTDFTTQTNNTTDTSVSNNNLLSLAQTFLSNVSTGFNSAMRSIGTQTGIIETGNAIVDVSSAVTANNNLTFVDAGGGGSITDPVDPTPTSSPVALTAEVPTPTPTPLMPVTGTTAGGTTTQQPVYYYYTYPAYQNYLGTLYPNSYFARNYRGYRSNATLLSNNPTTSLGASGSVLGTTSLSQMQTPQSKVAWFLLSVLSSLIGIGVYISRGSFLDPRLYS